MGVLHLEIIVDRLKREFNVDANVGRPQVAYRELVSKPREKVQGKFVRQTGGSGQYGDVTINLLPQEPERGLRVHRPDRRRQDPQGVHPGASTPASRRRWDRAFSCRLRPVVDIKIELIDGSYHDVDSSRARVQDRRLHGVPGSDEAREAGSCSSP